MFISAAYMLFSGVGKLRSVEGKMQNDQCGMNVID